MQLRRIQNSGSRFVKLPITQVITGFIAALLVGVSFNPVNAATMDSNISQVTDQLRIISDAVTRHFSTSNAGRELAGLVEDGLLAAVPQPPQGTGSSYVPSWRTDPTGTNKNKEVEYITLVEVSDDFCKAWNKAKHPNFGEVIMPSCLEATAPYTCAVSKLVVNVRSYSPPDQCGQTCCVAGNMILYRNGYAKIED